MGGGRSKSLGPCRPRPHPPGKFVRVQNSRCMDNNQQVERFDPSRLMEGVKDRIKSTFVSLIPDEMWSNMVEKEIYIFTTGKIIPHHEIDYSRKDENGDYFCHDWEERIPYPDTEIKDSWGRLQQPAEISPLRRMIRDELETKFRADLKQYLDGEEYQGHFNQYGKPEIGRAIKQILVDNADTIFFGFMESMMQSVFNDMRYRIAQQQHNF